MNNGLQIFNNPEFGQVRTMEIDGVPWFVGKDVAEALGYERADNAIRTHVDNEDKLMHQISASGQNRSMTIINESGLYALIFGSRLDSAKRFKRWVTSEVLPTLRKNGHYTMPGYNSVGVGDIINLIQNIQGMKERGCSSESIAQTVSEVCEQLDIYMPGKVLQTTVKEQKKIPDNIFSEVQLQEYAEKLRHKGVSRKKGIFVTAREFNDFCACYGIPVMKFKRWLYQNGYIEGHTSSKHKLEYTMAAWINSEAKRCILFIEK